MENFQLSTPTTKLGKPKVIFYLVGIFIFFLLFFFLFLSAPVDFPVGIIVNINQGESLRNISLKLEENHVIRSRMAFEVFVILYGAELKIMYSDYLFESKLPVWQVARRLAKGERHLAPVKITIPEGFNISEIAQVFTSKLPAFYQDKFLLEAKELEGYLFPDTYFFFTTDGEQEVIKSMSENFKKKLSLFQPQIILSGKDEKEIIIMASLVEKEAQGDNDRAFVSGILWKRFNMNMPLQVDAALETYKIRGLPKNPIGNPGLQAIKATIYPEKSNYLYYLHDKEGNIHYARTFEEHKVNKLKYLK